MTEKTSVKKAVKVKLEVDENLASGVYSNVCLINHSDSEFVLDAFFLQPQRPVAKHGARVVLSPRAAKRLLQLLADRMAKYESVFGTVEIGPSPHPGELN